jgi:hypothetical protein
VTRTLSELAAELHEADRHDAAERLKTLGSIQQSPALTNSALRDAVRRRDSGGADEFEKRFPNWGCSESAQAICREVLLVEYPGALTCENGDQPPLSIPSGAQLYDEGLYTCRPVLWATIEAGAMHAYFAAACAGVAAPGDLSLQPGHLLSVARMRALADLLKNWPSSVEALNRASMIQQELDPRYEGAFGSPAGLEGSSKVGGAFRDVFHVLESVQVAEGPDFWSSTLEVRNELMLQVGPRVRRILQLTYLGGFTHALWAILRPYRRTS